MKHKLVVFDWNSTLIADTKAAWLASNACLEFYGGKAITLERFRETFTFPVIHFYTLNGVSADTVLRDKDGGNVVFQGTYERLAARARTRTGARELLDWLTGEGYSVTILSNYLTDKINGHLTRLKIGHYFHHVCAHNCDGTTILQSTSKAQRLSDFMLKRNYKPADCVIIGDTMEEPEIARSLGLRSIGITDGCISRTRLAKAEPDHVVHSLSEVKNLLAAPRRNATKLGL